MHYHEGIGQKCLCLITTNYRLDPKCANQSNTYQKLSRQNISTVYIHINLHCHYIKKKFTLPRCQLDKVDLFLISRRNYYQEVQPIFKTISLLCLPSQHHSSYLPWYFYTNLEEQQNQTAVKQCWQSIASILDLIIAFNEL